MSPEVNMIVNSIIPRWSEEHQATIDVREQVEIPEGHWAVMIKIQIALHEDEMDYVHNSDTTKVDVLGGRDVQEIIIKQSESEVWYDRDDGPEEYYHWLNQTICFHSPHPFVVLESWESPLEGMWTHFATRVRERGLSMQLPEMDLPRFTKAALDEYGETKKSFKWCRITELAKLVGLPARKVLELHKDHMQGHSEKGVMYVCADSVESLRAADKAKTSWHNPDWDELLDQDPEKVWVRKRFALVVLYMKLIGWQDEQFKLERGWAQQEMRRKMHHDYVCMKRHQLALAWANYDTLQPVQG
jgi:hypothetical protein